MEKTIMFVGAGPYQLPGIEKAKEMGLKVVAVDRDKNAPGLKIADIPVELDIKDIEGCIDIAKKNKINGVLTIASDIAVPTVAMIAKELSLPGISPEVAKTATNKALMRKKFSEHDVPSPKFQIVANLQELKEAIEIIGLPAVIKPTDNAGSRGVSKVVNSEEILNAFNHALKNSREKRIIVEEFMEGIECTIEGLSYNNKAEILAISEKKKPEGPFRVATDLTYPPNFPNRTIENIKKVVKLAIESMGIDIGPTHSEVIVTEDGPKIVEVAARGGGFGVFSKIILFASGVDAVKENIKMSLGILPDIRSKYERGVVLRFFAPPVGRLKEVMGLEEAKSLENVEVGLYKEIGDIISPLATDGDRTGYIISWGNTREEAIQKADIVESKVKFVIE